MNKKNLRPIRLAGASIIVFLCAGTCVAGEDATPAMVAARVDGVQILVAARPGGASVFAPDLPCVGDDDNHRFDAGPTGAKLAPPMTVVRTVVVRTANADLAPSVTDAPRFERKPRARRVP